MVLQLEGSEFTTMALYKMLSQILVTSSEPSENLNLSFEQNLLNKNCRVQNYKIFDEHYFPNRLSFIERQRLFYHHFLLHKKHKMA